VRARFAAAFTLVLLSASFAGADAPPNRERENYLLHCSGCHGVDGRGVPGTTPNLHELAPLLAREGGRAYLSSVPGVAQASLSDVELARLLNWLLLEFSGVSPTPPYAPEEVAEFRADPIRDTVAARAQLTQP